MPGALRLNELALSQALFIENFGDSMKWFKHDTDASEDIKIRRLEEEFGNDGYATFFKTLEILGREGEKGRLNFKKYPKKWLSYRCHIAEEKLIKILSFMGEISLCCPKSLSKDELYIPKFKERADDYTKRVRRTSELPTDNVHVDKKRIEQIRTEYTNLKGFALADFTSNDFARTAKAIKTLILKAKDDAQIVRAFQWIDRQGYIDWTLETVSKKWLDFLKEDKKPDILKQFGKDLKKHDKH